MVFQIAFIIVTIGIFSATWAILEILFLEFLLSDKANQKRSNSVRNGFDK